MNTKPSTWTMAGLLLFLVLPISAGCTHLHEWKRQGKVGPDYEPPSAEVANEWQQYNNPYVISATHAVSSDCWWEAFGDPTIIEMVSAADSGNLPLRTAMLRVGEQGLLRRIAVGNLYPQQQEAFAEYSRIRFGDNGNQFGIPGFGQMFNLYEVGFNAAWEVDLWGRLRRIVESSDAEVQASMEDLHDVRLCLNADVVATYTSIRVLQQRILTAREQVAAQQETLRLANVRYKNGDVSSLDVTQADSVVESTRAAIPVLQMELQKANNQLCLLLGIPTQILFDEENIGDIPGTPAQVVAGMPCDLLRRRPDIRRAERKVAAQSARIGVAAAELFPTLALKGSISLQSFDISDLLDAGSLTGAAVPGFRWNILNYGRLKNQVSVEKNRLQQTVLSYRQVVLNANNEVEDALTMFSKKKEEIVALERAVASTRESLATATRQYLEGDVDLDRVNNLRKDLSAQLDLALTARGQAAISLIRVYKTMGGGWTIPGVPDPCELQHEPHPACIQATRPDAQRGDIRLASRADSPEQNPTVSMPNDPRSSPEINDERSVTGQGNGLPFGPIDYPFPG